MNNEKTRIESPKGKRDDEAQKAIRDWYLAQIIATETSQNAPYFDHYSIFTD
ncbi:MAG: hypothetical protein BWY14_01026 [Parcubacteria group bacterium ADurb.Bin192]|nr:MAG: hypothetical protein BWY14_01026 [Parcubacteria group bacterium ADurb.Bin192]